MMGLLAYDNPILRHIYSESTPWEIKALFYIGLYGFTDPQFPRKSDSACDEMPYKLPKFTQIGGKFAIASQI
jgi:hypothetical protein